MHLLKDLQDLYQFYKINNKQLNFKELELSNKIDSIENQIKFFNDSIDVINSFIEKTSGVIVVRVISNKNVKCNIELSYIVKKVSWLPEYDVVVKDISKSIEVIYKAKIFQNSGVDWNNVKLKLLTIKPNSTNKLPLLKPYYVYYNKDNGDVLKESDIFIDDIIGNRSGVNRKITPNSLSSQSNNQNSIMILNLKFQKSILLNPIIIFQ